MSRTLENLTPLERDALLYRWLKRDWFMSGGDSYLTFSGIEEPEAIDRILLDHINNESDALTLLDDQ